MTDEQTTLEEETEPPLEQGDLGDRAEAEGHPDAQDKPTLFEAEEKALAVREESLAAPTAQGGVWTREQVDLVKRTVAKGASDAELQLFMHVAGRTGLDVFAKQIYFIKRWDAEAGAMVFQPQTAIDGLRLIAERTGEYEGREGPVWAGEDGKWVDAWLSVEVMPLAAKVTVHRKGRKPTEAVALMREYQQRKKDGNPTRMWDPAKGMPIHMIGKVAESLALRAAFPQELGDVYSFEELPVPTDQGPDSPEGAIAEAEAVETASVETVNELKAELARIKSRPEWTEHAVTKTSAKVFGRKIEKLGDLTEDEARNIIDTAKKVQ